MEFDRLFFRLLAVVLLLSPLAGAAQVKVQKNANCFTYWQFEYGEETDTTTITVWRDGDCLTILTPEPEGEKIAGYCRTVTTVDYAADSITVTASYPDSVFFYRAGFSRSDLKWEKAGGKWKTSVNSNTLVFEMDEGAPVNVNPLPHYGLKRGVLRSYTRNGQLRLLLAKTERVRTAPVVEGNGTAQTRRVTPRELDRIMKQRLVVSTRIFDHEQICWGKENAHINGRGGGEPSSFRVPMDTVLHYAGGTVLLRRLSLPVLPNHYQHFVEVRQQSNGDAYDRTGSIFFIRTSGPVRHNFFDGVNWHPDSLPTLVGRDGERYQGVVSDDYYEAPVEVMRFFTPFGVGHFNERMQDLGVDWRKETFYRQEITDIYRGGDIIVGAWIGNYDAGGHLLTLDIKSYPNEYTRSLRTVEGMGWGGCFPRYHVDPLFNTCNVLEMAGQNYGKLFGTDSLSVKFVIFPRRFNGDTLRGARLRYISTGHGGWDDGDEFVPKQNTILIDGKVAFTHTPWRQDCGCYRDLNPVSGNFWNGLSSCDYSRSGWCPGTASQPVYFDLTPWADGHEHTLTVAIPQGKPVEGMFSHWAVSGALITEY